MSLSATGIIVTSGSRTTIAAAYALFSGVASPSSIGVLAAPLVHGFLHRFHLEEDASA